ncbi:MAG: hypothetical protein ABSE66_01095 [Thermoplasmata archaeon]|jgi:hypothetical protein
MSRVVHNARAFPNPAGWERFTRLSHQLLLPAAALTSLFLGLALLLDPLARVGVYTPFALLAVGLGALASSTSLYRWWNPLPLPGESVPAVGVATASRPTGPPTEAATGPADRPRSPITGRGSEWRVLSSPSDPGDETWLSWLPRERRRLGPKAIGSVPGVVHSPGKAGNLVAFPVRNYYHGVRSAMGSGEIAGSASLAKPPRSIAEVDSAPVSPPTPDDRSRGLPPPSPRAEPLSEEELDRLFPPVSGRRSVFLSEAPERVGGPSSWAMEPGLPADPPARSDESARSTERDWSTPEGDGDSPSRGVPFEDQRADRPTIPGSTAFSRSGPLGVFPRPDARSADLFLEAANPVPPHLRGTGLPVRMEPHRPARRSLNSASQRSVCASCSKVVVNLRMSGPCPKCLRPICNDCLRQAFVAQGHGWCLDCSSDPAPVPAG